MVAKGYHRQRTGAGGAGHERRAQIFPHHVEVVHSPDFQTPLPKSEEEEKEASELDENYLKLFSFEYYPHIAKAFFVNMDAASLMRCKLVCKEWCRNIQRYVEGSQRIRAQLLQRWKRAECSFFPVTPSTRSGSKPVSSGGAAGTQERRKGDISANIPDSSYRNVLSLKCDESEIMLAVDNGNVEIYDRRSLRLKTLLVGQFASSPTSLDFDSRIVLVGYTCGFRRLNRKFASSWNIYDRTTKALLHSVERFGDDDVRIGFDGHLYVTTTCGVFGIQRLGADTGATLKTRKVYAVNEVDTIEAFDLDKGHGMAVGIVRLDNQLVMRVWQKPDANVIMESESPPADFMTRLKHQFPVLDEYASRNDDFVELKCKCLSVQLRYPTCMCFFSNAYGYFEYFEDRGRPYSLLAFYDVESEQCLRVVRIDEGWMRRHEVVPYDYDSGVLSAKFSRDHLVLGFGSFSNRRDGGIALLSMSEVLAGVAESDMSVTKVPAPFYHRTGWDGHTGGVSALHVDAFQLVAVNSCVHQVSTRCIEGGDESRKDNVIVYDFWRPGKDLRR